MKVVIKIGGSLFMEKTGPRPEYMKKLIPILKQVDKEHKLTVVTGGGQLAREYLEKINDLGLDDDQREEIIIPLVHANTKLFSQLLNKPPVFDMDEFEEECVIGGIEPGQSTDTNAANAAKNMDADLLIKLTDVDGIYDKDPNQYEDVKKYDHLNFKQISFADRKTTPGDYGVMDPQAMRIIGQNKIKTIVCNGQDPKVISEILNGKKLGTEISD